MALTRWLRQALDRLRLERLRGALIAGESSGLGEDVSTDELMAELDEETRAEAKRKKAWSEIRRIIDKPNGAGQSRDRALTMGPRSALALHAGGGMISAWRVGNRSPQLSTPTIFSSSRSRRGDTR